MPNIHDYEIRIQKQLKGLDMPKNGGMEIQFLNGELTNFIGVPLHKGELYGLELELEGRGVAMGEVPTKGWKRDKDGSLRGESVEYISSNPATYEESIKRVNHLFKLFKENGVKIKNSYRTSTHVHINFSDRKCRDVVNFFCLFTILEQILEVYCGEGRAGNLFCLSSRDVEPVIGLLEDSIKRCDFRMFGEDIRYCALNLCALNKFGTLEVRTMRGAENAEQVLDWLNILHQMYDFACNNMKRPVELIENLSFLGTMGFLGRIFDAETLGKLIAPFDGRDIQASLYEGARLIQVFAYRNDDLFLAEYKEGAKKEQNPFLQNAGALEPVGENYIYNRHRNKRWHVTVAGRRHERPCEDDPRVVWNEVAGLWYDPVSEEVHPFIPRDWFGDANPIPPLHYIFEYIPDPDADDQEEDNYDGN